MFSCQAHLRRGELADAVLDGIEALEGIERWGAELAEAVAPAFWLARRSRLAIWTAPSGRSRGFAPPDGQAPEPDRLARFTS